MFAERQIAWAAQHDWFVRANADGTIIVVTVLGQAGKPSSVVEGQFGGSFAELRAWAGY